MKKLYYESPTVEVVDVRVEGGFNLSNGKAGADAGNWGAENPEEMEEQGY